MRSAVIPYPLGPLGWSAGSQGNEDGIIDALAKAIDPPRYFVEFGSEAGQCNCLHLSRNGWDGLFMDARLTAPHINKEWVTRDNINDLLDKYSVPSLIGVLSVDIDGEDIYVWEVMQREACIVVIEYNGHLPMEQSVAWPHDNGFVIKDKDLRYGASLKALDIVGCQKGYHLVYSNGANAFFVRKDLVENPDDFQYENVCHPWSFDIKDPIALGFVEIS